MIEMQSPTKPIKMADLHNDVAAEVAQTLGNKIKMDMAFRIAGQELGMVFPISAYGPNSPYADKVLFTDLPALKEGNVSLWGANVYADPKGEFRQLYPWQIIYYQEIFGQRPDLVKLVTDGQQLEEVLKAGKKTAAFHSVEGMYGADLGPDLLHRMWADGVRTWIPVHNNDSSIATGHGTKETSGATPLGYAMMEQADEMGFLFDHTHVSVATSKDIFKVTERSGRPSFISHTGSRAMVGENMTRATRDDIALEVVRRGGGIGVMGASWLHKPNKDGIVTVEEVVNTYEHYINIFGKVSSEPWKHLKVGTDGDGMGTESVIVDMEDIVKYGLTLVGGFRRRGFPEYVIEDIMHRNAEIFFIANLGR